jgi:hypothetical protein
MTDLNIYLLITATNKNKFTLKIKRTKNSGDFVGAFLLSRQIQLCILAHLILVTESSSFNTVIKSNINPTHPTEMSSLWS